VFVVARAVFKRWNPGAAEDGGVKVFIVARAIYKRRNPGAKKGMLRRAATRTQPPKRLPLGDT